MQGLLRVGGGTSEWEIFLDVQGKGGKGGRPRRQAADAFLQPHLSPSQNPVVDSKTWSSSWRRGCKNAIESKMNGLYETCNIRLKELAGPGMYSKGLWSPSTLEWMLGLAGCESRCLLPRGASQAPLTLRPAYLAILCLGRAGAAGPSAGASGAAGPGPGPSAPGPRGPLGCPLVALGVPGGTCQDLWTSLRDSPEQLQRVGGLKQSSWNDR